MAKQNQDFKVKDSVIIILNGTPLQTTISKKVTTETIDKDEKVCASYLYYTSATGDATPYKDSIYASKDEMLKSLGSAIDDKPTAPGK